MLHRSKHLYMKFLFQYIIPSRLLLFVLGFFMLQNNLLKTRVMDLKLIFIFLGISENNRILHK